MRTERVQYECDSCGRKVPARVVDTRDGLRPVIPIGWFELKIRHAMHDDDVGGRVGYDVCGVACATASLTALSGDLAPSHP